ASVNDNDRPYRHLSGGRSFPGQIQRLAHEQFVHGSRSIEYNLTQMFRYIPLVLKNCWRNRRRTALTIVSIGVSMCLLGVVISVYHAVYLSHPEPEHALRLITRNRISLTVPIPQFYRERIKQVPGVREVMIS